MDPNDSRPLPGLYIHIPFCLKKCDYCGFYSITDRTRIPDFIVALRREMALRRGWTASFDTIYIGGGTPSVLPSEVLENLIADIQTAFAITHNAEITVEANPADITPDLLTALRRTGVNRVNLGLQSLNNEILAFLGRRHDRSQAIAAVAAVRNAGIADIGIDLIYGIPGQEMASWFATLRETVALEPDHLSCYQLTPEDGTPLAERHSRGEIAFPGETIQADFFRNTSEFLEDNAFIHYEVSNFARPGRESRHNQKYWTHVPYLGLGPAAHSFSGSERRWNRRSVEAYIGGLNEGLDPVETSEILSAGQLLLEALFLGLRTRRGICLESFRIRHGLDLLADKRDILKRLTAEGLVEIRDGFLRPTRDGMAVADSLALI